MKRQYLIWSEMMTMIGHGYNSVTKTFDWPTKKIRRIFVSSFLMDLSEFLKYLSHIYVCMTNLLFIL